MDTSMTKQERIDQLLLIIAGCEVSLRQFPDDLKFKVNIEKTKKLKIEQLRKEIYGV